MLLLAGCIVVPSSPQESTPAPEETTTPEETPQVPEEETTPEVAPEMKTYSNFGFSFEYPADFTVSELALLEDVATDQSGIVIAEELSTDYYEGYMVNWMEITKSDIEAAGKEKLLLAAIDGGFASMTSSGADVARGELIEETKSGHDMYYQQFAAWVYGGEAHGTCGTWYCEQSERIYNLFHVSTILTTDEAALDIFRPFLASFKCH
jgi:hypothetical protein